MASLKDIAAELDVSVSLVSKVLNNRMGSTLARPQVIEAIRKKAKEMNYQKNSSAFSLSTGCHHTIGVFIRRHGEIGSGLLERLLVGIAEKARAEKYKITLVFFETAEEFFEICKDAHRGTMDGLIVGGAKHGVLVDRVCEIAKSGLPVVTVLNDLICPQVVNVGVNDESIGYLATKHLVDQGCRRIGHICIAENLSRYQGYCRAMRDAGLDIDPSWVFEAGELGFALEAGEAAARKFLRDRVALDGLVAESDQQVVGAMKVLLAASVRIPEDIKIIGVDNAPFCKFTPVQISSVSQRTVTTGRLAVELLLKMQAGEAVESIAVEPSLKVRRSSGGE